MNKKHIPMLGALNKISLEYIHPSMANKNDEYICPDCDNDLIIKKGDIRKHHFAHKRDDSKCTYYNHPTESQIHKDAKMLLKSLFENKNTIRIIKKCVYNKCNVYTEIEKLNDNSSIELEYEFEYNGKKKIADVAYIENDKLKYIFEICYTHKTDINARPEPWFEIDAVNLINTINNEVNEYKDIYCIREYLCYNCAEKKFLDLDKKSIKYLRNNQKDLEFYIRYRLGQRIFNYNYDKDRPCHERFGFDARDDLINNEENRNIIKSFNKFYIYKNVVIRTHKGGAVIRFIDINEDDRKYKYSDLNLYLYESDPDDLSQNVSGYGTVAIIKLIINTIPIKENNESNKQNSHLSSWKKRNNKNFYSKLVKNTWISYGITNNKLWLKVDNNFINNHNIKFDVDNDIVTQKNVDIYLNKYII
jgi:hypothetical protein